MLESENNRFFKVWFQEDQISHCEEILARNPTEAYRLGTVMADVSGWSPDRILVAC